jgi:hypothetical protein
VAIAVSTTAPLAAVLSGIGDIRDRLGEAPIHGLVPGLVVTDPSGWTPATRYADRSALPALISAAQRRWDTSPHVAAALAWKAYCYWLALPAVLGYAAGRVPDVSAGNVLLRPHAGRPFLEVGLCRPAFTAPEALRERMLDQHLGPVLDGLHELTNLGRRTLLGSIASGVAHALARAGKVDVAAPVLDALGVASLVEITPDGRVRRRTCCLAFALPEPKICQGCCLRA